MQAVISEEDATKEGEIPVFAFYDDGVTVDLAAHPEGSMIVSVPSNIIKMTSVGTRLSANWRNVQYNK